jgi:hypothetical protein
MNVHTAGILSHTRSDVKELEQTQLSVPFDTIDKLDDPLRHDVWSSLGCIMPKAFQRR